MNSGRQTRRKSYQQTSFPSSKVSKEKQSVKEKSPPLLMNQSAESEVTGK